MTNSNPHKAAARLSPEMIRHAQLQAQVTALTLDNLQLRRDVSKWKVLSRKMERQARHNFQLVQQMHEVSKTVVNPKKEGSNE